MITEEEISHQNNNIFDLSHPTKCDCSDFKIKQRHALLARTIGTKAEEESSHTHSHNLVISATASMVALCSLEAAAYFLYNRKVSIPDVLVDENIVIALTFK